MPDKIETNLIWLRHVLFLRYLNLHFAELVEHSVIKYADL